MSRQPEGQPEPPASGPTPRAPGLGEEQPGGSAGAGGMAASRSLYRRHRPRTFSDVVGQDSVVRTLRNAVELGRVHHAYLFVGSRGTGKTSMAKILAACLDCERGPTSEPCGVCASCRAIAEATSLDVIEMDAASNNSVEDIRALRDQVAFAPVSGRHKVYILDEAHMLSQAAWNAFLKTLEEPPPSTVFVLATTEAQKVPATVIDRCHRFDFHRPGSEHISTVLRRVAAAEGIEIPPEALAALARAADGSFRDALGTLEQLTTYSGPRIELSDVLAVLGVLDGQVLETLVDAVAEGDPKRVLVELAGSLEGGRDPGGVSSDIEARARELLVVQALGEVPAELSLTPDSDARLAAQAQRIGHATVTRLLALIASAREATRAGSDARTQLELALVRAARPRDERDHEALLDRIERLEARLQTAGPTAPTPPAPDAVADPDPGKGVDDPPSRAADAPPRAAAEAPPDPVAAPHSTDANDALEDLAAELPDEPLAALRALWPKALDVIRSRNALLWALVCEAQPVRSDGEQVTLAFDASASFLKRKAEDPAHFATVTAALKEMTGRPVRLDYELRDDLPHEERTTGEEELLARLIAEFDAEELPAAGDAQ
ncbi:MAG: DNA polymerase III subunit gamma/tau [Acidobacteriota bacterium]|nr:DNA polymerase III subunit gamma/tau [Acidobacteriota bacterium]